MPSSLLQLPIELLEELVSLVPDQKSLYRLLRCSRLLYNLILPHLYRDVKLTSVNHRGKTLSNHEAVYNFTCQIIRHHHRACLVRSFTLRERPCPPSVTNRIYPHTNPPREVVDDGIRRVVRRARATPMHGSLWMVAIKCKGSVDPILAVLLPYLPRLERLEITLLPSHIYCGAMLHGNLLRRGKAFPATAFQHLQHIIAPCREDQLHGNEPGGGLTPDQLAHFVRIPSLQSLTAHLCDDHFGDIEETEGELLESVGAFGKYGLYGPREAVYIARIRNLTSLKLTWARPRDLRIANQDLWKPSLCVHIAMLASQSLETLSLSYPSAHGFYNTPATDDLDCRSRMMLAGFPKLRHVTLGMAFVFGPRIFFGRRYVQGPPERPGAGDNDKTLFRLLPPTIETLRLVLCEEEDILPLWANVEALLWRKREGMFGKLTSVVVEGHDAFLRNDALIRTMAASSDLLGKYESDDVALELGKLAKSLGRSFGWCR